MVFLFAFIAVLLLTIALLRTVFQRQVRLEQRVQEILVQTQVSVNEAVEEAPNVLKYKPTKAYFSLRNVVRKELNQVGISFSRQEELVIGTVLVLVLLLVLIAGRGNVLFPVIVLLGLVVGFKLIIRQRKKRRRLQFEEGLLEMLTVATGALKAGYSLFQALDTVAKETRGLVSDEFRRIIKEISLGVTVEEALTHAEERVGILDFELIVNAILIQRQVGGNLAEVLDIAADTIRNRLQMRGEIRALTAQGRMSLWIFLLLTPAISLFMFLVNRSYISSLWTHPTGWLMLGVAVVGQGIGALIIFRIVNFDV